MWAWQWAQPAATAVASAGRVVDVPRICDRAHNTALHCTLPKTASATDLSVVSYVRFLVSATGKSQVSEQAKLPGLPIGSLDAGNRREAL